MNDTRPLALLTVVFLAFAGCSGGPSTDAGDGSPAPSPSATPPPPMTLLVKSQRGEDLPNATSPFEGSFDVSLPYRAVLVQMHASGVGTWRFQLFDPDGEAIHDSGDQVSTSEPDGHDHTGQAMRLPTAPGSYEARVDWTGAITYHLEVVAVVSETPDDHGHA